MAAAEEARQHLAQAEKALKPSWMSLKFNPDHLTASMEYAQAATKFRAAGLLQESVQAWVMAGDTKAALHDSFGAGRAYESAGAICDGSGPGGLAAAAENWEKAIRCFRLAGKAEIAAKLILKLAALREKEGDVAGAKAAYEDAIEVFLEDEKDHNLCDVYKQYIGFLVRSGLFAEAPKAIDGHIKVLKRQGHDHFVYKEALAKVVLFLHMQDTVRAEDALNEPAEVRGWFTSKEAQSGAELVAAFQNNDAEEVQRVMKDQTFTFLQVEIARLAKQLRLPSLGGSTAAVRAAGAAPAAAPAGAGPAAVAEVPQQPASANPEDVAELLM
uniref:Gamma-soluble NSF attachment protein n=1 Tax=Alexandrium monilatum TaxID=311494 RepID=A0A7S4UFZ8_9DINO|mmetsp:Transcript_5910/g.17647  ORF Transcript_5910/g.17647 Transcript_5910/m.17647 type:complete len:328 (-) Transcript_5910:29-1012(-)